MHLIRTIECAAETNERFLVDVYSRSPAGSDGQRFAFLRYPTFEAVKIVGDGSFRLPKSGELIIRVGSGKEILDHLRSPRFMKRPQL